MKKRSIRNSRKNKTEKERKKITKQRNDNGKDRKR